MSNLRRHNLSKLNLSPRNDLERRIDHFSKPRSSSPGRGEKLVPLGDGFNLRHRLFTDPDTEAEPLGFTH